MENNTQHRKWHITINNPLDYGFSHDVIKNLLSNDFKSLYVCMADEKGTCVHTHIYVVFKSPIRFNTIKNRFNNKAHIEPARGNSQQNRDYIAKEGIWIDDEKHGTKIANTFEEIGEIPKERQGARNDLTVLYEMVKDGQSNYEILESRPEFLLRLNDIERTRQMLIAEENRDLFRNLDVTYIWGYTGTGKTRYVMETHGYINVYRITDYKHPFDSYKSEDVILFDEFCGAIRIQDMNNYLDGYPIDLPCRYANKQACYTKVYIVSNIDLKAQYMNIFFNEREVWNAFVRRIHRIIRYYKDGTSKIFDTAEYMLYGDESPIKENPFIIGESNRT